MQYIIYCYIIIYDSCSEDRRAIRTLLPSRDRHNTKSPKHDNKHNHNTSHGNTTSSTTNTDNNNILILIIITTNANNNNDNNNDNDNDVLIQATNIHWVFITGGAVGGGCSRWG